MVGVKSKSDVLIAVVLTEEGIASIRIGSNTDQGMGAAYAMLRAVTPEIRSLHVAARLANLGNPESKE